MKEPRECYQNLYSYQESDGSEEACLDFTNNKNIPKLAENGKALLCEGKLSLAKYYAALNKFPNGKAPGNDGITPELYKCFWNLLGQQLTDALNYSFDHGELSNTIQFHIYITLYGEEKIRLNALL